MKASDLNAKDVKSLNQELSELLKAQFKLRMQKGTQQLSDTSQLGKVKRDIARIFTVMRERELGIRAVVAAAPVKKAASKSKATEVVETEEA